MKVVFLTDRHRGSFRVIESLYTSSLKELGVEVISEETPVVAEEFRKKVEQYAGRVVFHNTLGESFVPLPGCVNIALPVHEWSRYPPCWARLLNGFDQIWVTTKHVRKVLLDSGIKVEPQKIPPALDLEETFPKENWVTTHPFRFFSCGEPHFRKGHHLLMAGFLRAFPKEGEATLTIKTSPSCNWESPRSDIRIVAEDWSRSRILESYRGYDGYATASLAEGFGLHVAEAVLSGLPVTANCWGGHASLLAEGSFVPMGYEEILQPFASCPEFYAEGQRCAFSSPNEVSKALRFMASKSQDELAKMASRAKDILLETYGKSIALELLKKALGQLT